MENEESLGDREGKLISGGGELAEFLITVKGSRHPLVEGWESFR